MSAGTCGYRFDPAVWEREHGRPAALDAEWSCPRDAEDGTDYCRYHLPPDQRRAVGIDEKSLRDSLLEEIAKGDESSLQFVGCEFGDIDISYRVLNRVTNYPIDLRHATIHGDLLAEQAVIRQPILIDEITIKGAVDFFDAELGEDVSARHASFEGEVTFEGAEFEDNCWFTNSKFTRPSSFDGVQFMKASDFDRVEFQEKSSFEGSEWRGRCRFQDAEFNSNSTFMSSHFYSRANFQNVHLHGTSRFNHCVFDDVAVFMDCEFEAEALFKKVKFSEAAHYQYVDFHSEASFSMSAFGDKAKFQFADFGEEASISYVKFSGATYFKAVDFNDYASFYKSTFDQLGDFRKAMFTDTARFLKTEFHDEVFFDQTTFVGHGDFRRSEFHDSTYFVESELHLNATLRESLFSHLVLHDIETPVESITIDLDQAKVDGGRFVQKNGEEIYYNLRDGEIGDVNIEVGDLMSVFDRIFIYRTDFDDFDFSNYRYELAPNWNLHNPGDTIDDTYDLEADRVSLNVEAEGGDDLEEGPDGPSQVSSSKSDLQSRFMNRVVNPEAPDLEVTYLKAKNGAELVGDNQSASRFFIKEMYYRRQAHMHRALNYQESLLDKLKLLFLVIMNLTLSLTCGYGEKPRRTLGFSIVTIGVYAVLFSLVVSIPPFDSRLGYVLLSVQSFASLIFGSTASIPEFAGSFLAASEGFVGAFMIGLFIFALTRSVHR